MNPQLMHEGQKTEAWARIRELLENLMTDGIAREEDLVAFDVLVRDRARYWIMYTDAKEAGQSKFLDASVASCAPGCAASGPFELVDG